MVVSTLTSVVVCFSLSAWDSSRSFSCSFFSCSSCSFFCLSSCSFLCCSSLSFLCFSSCALFYRSYFSFLCLSSCSFLWSFVTTGGSLDCCRTCPLDEVTGVLASKSRGRVCNLYSLSLLNLVSLSSLYFNRASSLA